MAEITLHYFPVRGKGEHLELMLKHQGVEYTRNTILPEQWRQEIKTSGLAQFQSLPVLEIDGHKLIQTIAIGNYLGKKYGYYSEDPYQAYLIDSLVLYAEDVLMTFVPFIRGQDIEGGRKHLQEKAAEFLTNFEKRLTSVNGGDGFFACNRVTVADFFAFRIVHDWYYEGDRKEWSEAIFDEHAPKLKEWMQRMINSSETFKAYVEAREPDPRAPQLK